MFSREGSARRFVLNRHKLFSRRNCERVRCNFVMDASGFGVSFRKPALSGTHFAAIGLVVRFNSRDTSVSCCNRFRDGEITTFPFELLVASLVFGSEALGWGFLIWSFGFGSSFEFWAKETLGCDPSPRVGACGRRPSESADPRIRRAGGCRRSSVKGFKS